MQGPPHWAHAKAATAIVRSRNLLDMAGLELAEAIALIKDARSSEWPSDLPSGISAGFLSSILQLIQDAHSTLDAAWRARQVSVRAS